MSNVHFSNSPGLNAVYSRVTETSASATYVASRIDTASERDVSVKSSLRQAEFLQSQANFVDMSPWMRIVWMAKNDFAKFAAFVVALAAGIYLVADSMFAVAFVLFQNFLGLK